MAIYRKGFLGSFSGKVGPGIGSSWRGLDILKGRTSKTIEKDKLLPQNFRLDVMSRFLSCFGPQIKIGFYHKKNKDSPFNRAMHYNLERAITGVAPNFIIDYKKVILSRGDREPVWGGKLILESNDQVKISWEVTETAKMKVIGNDMAMILIYSDKDELAFYTDTAIRSDLSDTVVLPYRFLGGTCYLWMFFISPDGKSVSNSDYLGAVTTEPPK